MFSIKWSLVVSLCVTSGLSYALPGPGDGNSDKSHKTVTNTQAAVIAAEAQRQQAAEFYYDTPCGNGNRPVSPYGSPPASGSGQGSLSHSGGYSSFFPSQP